MSEKPKKAEVINLAEYREHKAVAPPGTPNENPPDNVLTYFDGQEPTLHRATALARDVLASLEKVPLDPDALASQKQHAVGYSTDDLRNILGIHERRLHFYSNEFMRAVADEFLARLSPETDARN